MVAHGLEETKIKTGNGCFMLQEISFLKTMQGLVYFIANMFHSVYVCVQKNESKLLSSFDFKNSY